MSDYSIVPEGEEGYPLTHFAMARFIGLSEVTEKNWRKVYTRAVQVQAAQGHDVKVITPELVRRHIGQELGAYELSDAGFRKQVGELVDNRLLRELKQWEASQGEEPSGSPADQ